MLHRQPDDAAGRNARVTRLRDHLRAIHRHTGPELVDWVVVNNRPIAPEVARRYRAQGRRNPCSPDIAELQRMGLRCVFDNLLETHGVVRHDARKLASPAGLEEFVCKSPRP